MSIQAWRCRYTLASNGLSGRRPPAKANPFRSYDRTTRSGGAQQTSIRVVVVIVIPVLRATCDVPYASSSMTGPRLARTTVGESSSARRRCYSILGMKRTRSALLGSSNKSEARWRFELKPFFGIVDDDDDAMIDREQ
jgi:hypothetical protein